jgi:hypothetical protein
MVREWPEPITKETIMSDTTKTTAWAVKRINFFFSGTFYATQDDYLRLGDGADYGYGVGSDKGKIIAVADRAAAERIAEAVADGVGTYILAHGEYERPSYAVRRVKIDPARVMVVDESEACRLLDLDYDLEVA